MKNFPLFLLSAGVILIISCQQKSEQISVATNEITLGASFNPPKVKEVKLGAPVSLASATIINIHENSVSREIILLKASKTIAGRLQVELNVSEGLQLVNGAQEQNLNINTKGYYSVPVTIMAPKNGRFYLHLKVTLNDGENISFRRLSVVVQVGPSLEADTMTTKMLKPSTDENLISLPAQESISNND